MNIPVTQPPCHTINQDSYCFLGHPPNISCCVFRGSGTYGFSTKPVHETNRAHDVLFCVVFGSCVCYVLRYVYISYIYIGGPGSGWGWVSMGHWGGLGV